MGKPNKQIFPDFINELCRRPRGTKGQEMLSGRGAKQRGVISEVSVPESVHCPVGLFHKARYPGKAQVFLKTAY